MAFWRKPKPLPAPAVVISANAAEVGPDVSLQAMAYRIGAVKRDFERRKLGRLPCHPDAESMLGECQLLGATLVQKGSWTQGFLDSVLADIRGML